MGSPIDKDSDKEKLDDVINKFKKTQDKTFMGEGVSFIKDHIDGIAKDELEKVSMDIKSELGKVNESISMYSKITIAVERRMTVMENNVKGSIGVIKFLFGGGVILTLINVIVMIFIAVLTKA